jgi:hypothetical protein
MAAVYSFPLALKCSSKRHVNRSPLLVASRSKAEVFQFIEVNRAEHDITMMCRLYGVTRAGYYAWRSRERSERERQNEALAAQIRAVHAESRGIYGSPRVHRALRKRGHRVGKNRVARLMRRHGIKARVATMRHTSPGMQRYFGSVLNEQLDLELKGPDQVWVGDITYLKIGAVYRYLAVVMDKYSRRVVGWSYGSRKDVALTLRALNSAVRQRRPALSETVGLRIYSRPCWANRCFAPPE